MDLEELLGENYREDMTLEEIKEALAGIELNQGVDDSVDAEIKRLKNALTKSNHEASKYKKELRAKLSDEEIAKENARIEREELEEKYNALLLKTTISEYTSNFLSAGYDEQLARDTATAMANGEMDKVFANQQTHLANVKKQMKAEMLKSTPEPVEDGDSNVMTLEKLKSLSMQERAQYSHDHPQEYKELYQGGIN